MDDGIHIRRRPKIGNALQNWVILESSVDDSGGALFAVGPVMINPGFSQHLLTKTARPIFILPIVFCVWAVFVMFVSKGVRAGAQSDNRFSTVQKIHKMLHLFIRELAKSQSHDA